MSKPLFVPLKARFFDLFADGRKRYELRRRRGQWTTKHVYLGRPVTLSYGYGKHHRLTGVVLDVKTAPTVAGIFERIPYQQIMPLADSKGAAVAAALDTLGQDCPVIAFEASINAAQAPECPRCRNDIWCFDGLQVGGKTRCEHCGAPLQVQGSMYDKIMRGQVPCFICDVPRTNGER